MEFDLVAHNTMSIREYGDGRVTIQWARLDQGTRRYVWADPFHYRQSESAPLTVPELALMAAAERVAADLGYQPELPW
jgi:hypothetical protein